MQANSVLRQTIVCLLYATLLIPFYVANGLLFPFIAGKGFAFRIVVELALALWAILAARDPRYRPNWKSPVLLAGGALLLVTFLSDALGADPYVSFWSSYERMDGFVLLAHVGAYVLVLASVFKTPQDWRRFFVGWLVSAAGMCAFAATQILGYEKINQGASRIDGTLGNAVYMAGMMLFSVGFAAMTAIWTKETWARNAALALGLVATVALFWTATRGSAIGLVVGAFFAGILFLVSGRNNPHRKAGWWLVGSLAVLCLVALASFRLESVRQNQILGRFASTSLSDKTVLSRVINAEIAWQGFLERPLLGWGQGNYSLVFDAHYDTRMHDQEQYFDRTHSILTDWLVTGGALGWLAYFALFGIVAWAIWRAEALSRGERIVLVATLLAYLVHNLAVFDNLVSYMQYGALVALAASLGPAKPSRRVELGADARNLVAVASLVFAVFAVYAINVPAINAGQAVIQGLQVAEVNEQTGTATLYYDSVDRNREYFESALAQKSFGSAEATQQFVQAAGQVGMLQGLPADSRDKFFASALAAVRATVAAHPRDARYHALLGSFYGRLGQLPEAQAELEAAVLLAPQKQSVRLPLALVYAAEGDKAKAIAFAKATYEINKEDDPAWLALMRLAIRLKDQATFSALVSEAQAAGRADRIVMYAQAAVSSNPEEPQNRAALAKALTDAGQYDAAVATLESAAADFPKQAANFKKMEAQVLAASGTVAKK